MPRPPLPEVDVTAPPDPPLGDWPLVPPDPLPPTVATRPPPLGDPVLPAGFV
ncbi:MAG: hypothetical protein ABW321_14100 [Polyangiales bacterium]